jgi:hypothetical protein
VPPVEPTVPLAQREPSSQRNRPVDRAEESRRNDETTFRCATAHRSRVQRTSFRARSRSLHLDGVTCRRVEVTTPPSRSELTRRRADQATARIRAARVPSGSNSPAAVSVLLDAMTLRRDEPSMRDVETSFPSAHATRLRGSVHLTRRSADLSLRRDERAEPLSRPFGGVYEAVPLLAVDLNARRDEPTARSRVPFHGGQLTILFASADLTGR